MRTIYNQNGIKITGPEYAAHKGDNNFYLIQSDKAGLNVQMTIIVGNIAIAQFSSITAGSVVRFDISDLIRIMQSKTTIGVSFAEGGGKKVYTVDTILVCDGVTNTTRYPSSESVIEVPDGVKEVDVFVRESGTSISDGVNRQDYDVPGIYAVDLSASPASLSAKYAKPIQWGDKAAPSLDATHAYQIVRRCVPEDGIVLQYTNNDGCTRYKVGKVLRRGISVASSEYVSNADEVRDRANRIVDGVSHSVTIGFSNVPDGQHLDDILCCDVVDVFGGDMQLIPKTSTIEHDGKTRDVVLTFDIR